MKKKTVGIVGGGPCGLYLAFRLLQECEENLEIHLFEKEERVGGRARMDIYHDIHVVMGAGIVRHRDVRLIRLARSLGVPLRRFTTRVQYEAAAATASDPWDVGILSGLIPHVDRTKTFAANMTHLLGRKMYRGFRRAVGATDYENADAIDTLLDFGFQDNLSGQVMYGIDWDRLMERLLHECTGSSAFHLHLATPITAVRCQGAGFVLNGALAVDDLFWTAPRPSWDVLPVWTRSTRLRDILGGVACQSFLRAYAVPTAEDRDRAHHLYPMTTYLDNPLQRIIPYKKDVYMIAYCDNRNADTVLKKGKDLSWLHEMTGVRWADPIIYYHPCGTHYFRPLNEDLWKDRDAFLRRACHPMEHLYLCGEGLSRNQGWTEGALESADGVIALFCRR